MQQQNLFIAEPEPWEVDAAEEHLAASVVFAEAPHGPFDYLVPDGLRGAVEPGRRVRVPLGKGNRSVVGYCVKIESRQEEPRKLKPVQTVVDVAPLLSPSLLRLTEWMADYYLCEWGTVIEAVLPAGVRGQAGTREQTFLSVTTNVAAHLTQLKLPAKQAEVLQRLAASPRPLTPHALAKAAGCTLAPLNELRKKGLIKAETRRVERGQHDLAATPREEHLVLNADQQAALSAILEPLHAPRHETIVMHGVTGSGKTEVYIRAIDEVIHFGRQAIVLVPEISLTPQTRERFRCRFERVAVLHSHLSPAERHWHWQRIARGEIQVVVGARSAVFAPTPHLGLIVLDEEHDTSFKQDSAPRYHARDVALRRAQAENIPLVLGSATPSLESWQKAALGEYRLVDMPRRVSDRPLPDVATIDLRTEFQNRSSRGAVSRQLHQAIDQALKEGGQVILLLNRRGFATHIQCPACGHVVRCPDCDLALTHHRDGEKAICHYCDYEIVTPHSCPSCHFAGIQFSGLGTQRLEQEILARFRDVATLRMDSDTMDKPGSHEQALDKFRRGEVRILLGTQMIAKGLDFPDVTLVGVINADTALHFPDFRAAERTFQLVTQVAGRTGRGEKGGRVLVQTFSPEHPAIQAAIRHDYAMFAGQELPTRAEYGYPPLSSMVRLIFRGESQTVTEKFAEHLTDQVRAALEPPRSPHAPREAPLHAEREDYTARVLGPAAAPMGKLRGKYRFHTLLFGPNSAMLRDAIRTAARDLEPPEDVQWVADVDPLDML